MRRGRQGVPALRGVSTKGDALAAMHTIGQEDTTNLNVPSFRLLHTTCAEYMDKLGLDLVERAFLVAAEAHEGVRRDAGEPYIEHPLAVSLWLAQRHVAADCIAAALLHDVVEDTDISLASLRSRFGPIIAALVDGVTKFDAVETPDIPDVQERKRERKSRQQSETFRKLLLAMAEDPRVALIKLADRLHNLRTLGAVSRERQLNKARETMDIYVPLAYRLGMAEVKYELEDLAFRYSNPERHAWLTEQIAVELERRRSTTHATVNALGQLLNQQGIAAEVGLQIKHLYSVHRRISPYDMAVGDVTDLVTYRVLVNKRSDCYSALLAIHSRWLAIDARLRDYVGTPKLNGYQAMHTTVFGPEGLLDIHIRTHEMQAIADHGPVLLGARQTKPAMARSSVLQWIDQVRGWQQELSLSAKDFISTVQDDLFHDQIFVLTPKGEVKDLPVGATVLDFAYRIHTTLGLHCGGAVITGSDQIRRSEPRDYQLKSGDIVEIVQDVTIRPDATWLAVAQTHHARDAILHYLRTHDIPTQPPPVPAAGEIVETIGIRQARLAMCCEPIPGDELVGLVTDRRMIVHRVGCRYATCHAHDAAMNGNGHDHGHLRRASDHRHLPVRWEMINPPTFRTSLTIIGQERVGLMYDLANVMTDTDINVLRSVGHGISARVKADIWVRIEVSSEQQLRRLYDRLNHIDGVVRIKRRDRILTATNGQRHS